MASDDVEVVACQIAAIVEKSRIAQICMSIPPKKTDTYVGAFVKRKLLLVCWVFGGLPSLDWEKVAMPTMLS